MALRPPSLGAVFPKTESNLMFRMWTRRIRELISGNARLSKVWQSAQRVRYHGIWTPGVRLMQGLRFGAKALVIVVSLALPLGLMARHDWLSHQAEVDALHQAHGGLQLVMALGALQAMSQDVERVAFKLSSLNDSSESLSVVIAEERQAFEAAQAMFQTHDGLGRGLSAQFALVNEQRVETLKLMAASAKSGGFNPAAHRAMDLYMHRLEALRMRMLRLANFEGLGDSQLTALMHSGLEILPNVIRHLHLITGASYQLFQSKSKPINNTHRLIQLAAMLELETGLLERDGEMAVAAGHLSADEVRSLHDSLRIQRALVTSLVKAGLQYETAREVQSAVGLDADAFREKIEATKAMAERLLQTVSGRSEARVLVLQQSAQEGMQTSIGVISLGLGLAVYLMICMNKVVGGGLKELSARVAAVAEGDLSERPQARGTDEVGQAMTSLAASVRRMNTLFEAVTQGVAAVSHASREVANGNAGLSGRTADIRQAIGDVGERARIFMDAMNRCDVEVERIAEHMRDVRVDARRSRIAMGELQDCMKGLRQNSRDIARVITLVEVVAHQTRLLSLNASVEAARAGPSGKGFSVVAAEVRDLARRSEDAARKIHDIVNASINEIEQGAMLSDRVDESVRNTDERISEVSHIVSDIVHLTRTGRDQSQEVVGITRDVEGSADGNARMVEQLAHASADLRNHGDNLKRSIQHFVFT